MYTFTSRWGFTVFYQCVSGDKVKKGTMQQSLKIAEFYRLCTRIQKNSEI